jgi:UPF0755 protein
MDEILDIVTRGGASTCGTEVQLRIGVTRPTTAGARTGPGDGPLFVEIARLPAETEEPAEELDALMAQPDTRFRVVVAEGATSWQVWERAERGAEFLEGDWPRCRPRGAGARDSYEVRRGQERAALVAEMQARQEAILAAAWENRAEGVPVASPRRR